MDRALSLDDVTCICVDTTGGNGKHPVKSRIRENGESNQASDGEDSSEKTRLNGTTNKSVEDCICLVEATSLTEDDDS